ncbi:MAG: TerD family protein [Synergistaceae bacterium]|jgi:stress response protein SCP2|nr:TerD family protein [Synergistaceae bacterium]
MSVNLQKGQKVDLTKGNAGLGKLMVGLGWDEAPQPKGGLLSGILGGGKQDIDCDAMAFLLGANGKLSSSKDAVFFNNLNHPSGCVTHQGDNLTGAGEGDDEQILIDLISLPKQYERIVIAVSIYKANERRQHFGMIRNAFIRLVDVSTNKELYKYNLSDDYPDMTAMIFGEVYRHNGEWKFGAVGEGLRIWSVTDLCARYGLA